MNIIFRVDSYLSIGSGHLIRCLNLAEELKKSNDICFITIASDYFVELIKERGYQVSSICDPSIANEQKNIDYKLDALRTIQIIEEHYISADILICDNYFLDKKWEEKLRNFTKKIIVIDDLANREHACDLLIDQNLVNNMNTRYENLVQKNTELLLGPEYVILGQEYSLQRENISIRNNDIKRVLISFGGVDEFNITGKLIDYFSNTKFKHIQFEVAVTDSFVFLDSLLGRSNPKNMHIHKNVDSLAFLMKDSDIAIGAGGTTTWERMCMGLPSVVLTIADNQVESTKQLKKMELIHWIGHYNSLKKGWKNTIGELVLNNTINEKMSKNSLRFVDGLGARKVAERILKLKTEA